MQPGTIRHIKATSISKSGATITATWQLEDHRRFMILGIVGSANAATDPHKSILITSVYLGRQRLQLISGDGPGVPAAAVIGTDGVLPPWHGSRKILDEALRDLLPESLDLRRGLQAMRLLFGDERPARAFVLAKGGTITLTATDYKATPADNYSHLTLVCLDLGNGELPPQNEYGNNPCWMHYSAQAMTTTAQQGLRLDDTWDFDSVAHGNGGAFLHLATFAKLLLTSTLAPATADSLAVVTASQLDNHFTGGLEVPLSSFAQEGQAVLQRWLQDGDAIGWRVSHDALNAASTLVMADYAVPIPAGFRIE